MSGSIDLPSQGIICSLAMVSQNDDLTTINQSNYIHNLFRSNWLTSSLPQFTNRFTGTYCCGSMFWKVY